MNKSRTIPKSLHLVRNTKHVLYSQIIHECFTIHLLSLSTTGPPVLVGIIWPLLVLILIIILVAVFPLILIGTCIILCTICCAQEQSSTQQGDNQRGSISGKGYVCCTFHTNRVFSRYVTICMHLWVTI